MPTHDRHTCFSLPACALALAGLATVSQLAGCGEDAPLVEAPPPSQPQAADVPAPDASGTAPSHRSGSSLGAAKRSAVNTRDAVEDRQRQMEEQIKEMEGGN
ncbi:MAG: hypothetical protein ACYTF9_05340 [Planctomycetota bacterium]|jgi:hypothetical protein